MKNYKTSDEILLDKLLEFTLVKNLDYKTQLENNLRKLSKVWQSLIPVQPYEYELIDEYNDVVIAKLITKSTSKKGRIKVN